MIAFDTDILTAILVGAPEFVTRASSIPRHEQAVPVVVIEEIIRGRLQVIRQAEAGTARVDLARAYSLFEQTIRDVQRLTILAYTPQADMLYRQWRQQHLMRHFYHRIAHGRVATDQEPCLDEAVDPWLCRWGASKVRQWRAPARRDATFWVNFDQLSLKTSPNAPCAASISAP